MKTKVIAPAFLLFASVVAPAQAEGPPGHAFPPPSPELIVGRTRVQRSLGIHPSLILRDILGQPVEDSKGLVSFARTCGKCHDAAWIGQHGYHFLVGANEQVSSGKAPSGRPWDFGPGLFGRWDPLAGYDSVMPSANHYGAAVDRWIDENRQRLTGGGPAMLGDQSRGFEPNCAICHVRGAKIPEDSRWPLAAVSTATLLPLGLVELLRDESASLNIAWKSDAFAPDGTVDASRFVVQAPSSESCGQCHGVAGTVDPKFAAPRPTARMTETTGQLFLSSRISDSTLNVERRDRLARPWDVHAERMVTCSDCHFSPNDPSATFRKRDAMPEHLQHEVRNLPLGEFLRQPDHDFAKGYSTQGQVANARDGTMRRCENCHDAMRVHRWLPKAERHLEQVGCETCHLDAMHAPARRVTDFSLVDAEGRPRVEYRGLAGAITDPAVYLPEYRPLLLRRREPNGKLRLLPYNVTTTFFWVVETPDGPRPAPTALLKRALIENATAAATLNSRLDHNHDGRLDDSERVLLTESDVTLVRALLVAAGAQNPKLVGEIEPYGIHHGMAPARFALRDCDACHSGSSRLSATYELAEKAPFGVAPKLLADSNVLPAFRIERSSSAQLVLLPDVASSRLHVFGLSRRRWVDGLGLLVLSAVFAGALGHGALRIWSSRRRNGRSS